MPCACGAAESLDIFDEKAARRALRRYLRNGLGGSDALQIADWAEDGGLEGRKVVEIGGGVGQLQAELVRRGADEGAIVEVVDSYRAPAAELAEAIGIADRTTFVLADLLEAPEAVEPADIVVLRRVVCCSPRGPELLGIAASKTRRRLLASYPRDRAAARFLLWLANTAFRVARKRFRSYVHRPDALERAAAQRGLSRTRVSRGLMWETAQFDVAAPMTNS